MQHIGMEEVGWWGDPRRWDYRHASMRRLAWRRLGGGETSAVGLTVNGCGRFSGRSVPFFQLQGMCEMSASKTFLAQAIATAVSGRSRHSCCVRVCLMQCVQSALSDNSRFNLFHKLAGCCLFDSTFGQVSHICARRDRLHPLCHGGLIALVSENLCSLR